MLYYQSGAATKTGKRDNNQDNYYLNGLYNQQIHDDCSDESIGRDKIALFAVADGMGGEKSGERASFLLTEGLSKIGKQAAADMPEVVSRSILGVNETLCAIMKSENSGRMGSTVVSLLYTDPFVYINNLGDSPAYLCRDGELKKLTKDHTEGQAMLDGGVLSKEQLLHHSSRNRLTRHLGIFPSEMELEVAQYPPISPIDGDVFLLCSDGVSGVFSDEQLRDQLSMKKTAHEISESIVSESLRLGSKDNCTAVVVKFSLKQPQRSVLKIAEKAATVGEKDKTVTTLSKDSSQTIQEEVTIIRSAPEEHQNLRIDTQASKLQKRIRGILIIAMIATGFLLLAVAGYLFFTSLWHH